MNGESTDSSLQPSRTVNDLDRKAIVEIVNHYMADEEKNYCETFPDDDHIYYALKHMQRWLERNL